MTTRFIRHTARHQILARLSRNAWSVIATRPRKPLAGQIPAWVFADPHLDHHEAHRLEEMGLIVTACRYHNDVVHLVARRKATT